MFPSRDPVQIPQGSPKNFPRKTDVHTRGVCTGSWVDYHRILGGFVRDSGNILVGSWGDFPKKEGILGENTPIPIQTGSRPLQPSTHYFSALLNLPDPKGQLLCIGARS